MHPASRLPLQSTNRPHVCNRLRAERERCRRLRHSIECRRYGGLQHLSRWAAPKPAAIAVDPTGSYVSVVTLASALAQLSPGNAAWVYSTVTPVGTASTLNLAVAPNGDTVLYSADSNGNWSLERVHPTGTVVFSQATPSSGQTLGVPVQLGLALDAAGNAYVTGFNGTLMHPVLDSLASADRHG